jgi:hypothetical protein
MPQLTTMLETNKLILAKIRTTLKLPRDPDSEYNDVHIKKRLIQTLNGFEKMAAAHLDTDLHRRGVEMLADKEYKLLIAALLSLYEEMLKLQQEAKDLPENNEIQNAVDQAKANMLQLDESNVAMLFPVIQQQVQAAHAAIEAQKNSVAVAIIEPTPSPLQTVTLAATSLDVNITVTTSPAQSQSESKSESKKSKSTSSSSSRRRPIMFHFGIRDDQLPLIVKTPELSPSEAAANQGYVRMPDAPPTPSLTNNQDAIDSAPLQRPTPLKIKPDNDSRIATVPYASGSSLKMPLLVNVSAPVAVRTALADQDDLMNQLYKILERALYTHAALNFLSEQVQGFRGGVKLDKELHARVKRYDDYMPAGQVVPANVKTMVDIFTVGTMGQFNKLTHLIDTASSASEQRWFCCFQPAGRTNAMQKLYSLVGKIDIENLSAASMTTLQNELGKISPQLVDANPAPRQQASPLA